MYVEPTWVFRTQVKILGSLRWRYNIKTYVEDTGYQARERGLSVFFPEGETTTEKKYPLNQVELWGGDFDPNVKVVVSPSVTQIYFSYFTMVFVSIIQIVV